LGFIGSEVAASLRQLGVEVTALAPDQAPLARVLRGEGSDVLGAIHRELGVEVTARAPDQAPLARVLGGEVGDVLGAIHREKGVDLVLGDSVAAFEGSGRVERVRATSGR